VARQQVIGNIGMYYAAYRLSRMGWNVMPTSRNARGIDLLIYDASARHYKGIQVKALSKLKPPVPLGLSTDNLMGDWWIIVTKAGRGHSGMFHHETGGSQRTCAPRRERGPRFILAATKQISHG
jgi:hypothetical protein